MPRIPRLDSQYAKERFFHQQRPYFWWQKARELAESAEILRRNTEKLLTDQKKNRRFRRKIMAGVWQGLVNPPSYEPSNLLYALAIENALKGILIGQDNDLISEKRMSKTVLDTAHNLRKIATISKLDLSEGQLDLLDKLSETIQWAGRYPIPRNENEIMPIESGKQRRRAGLSFWGTEREETMALYRHLDGLLLTLLDDKYSEPAWI